MNLGESEHKERTRVALEPVWVVDWDISLGKDRFRFYRALKRLKKEMQLDGQMSTMSVLITADKELAWRVYSLVINYADRAHIYEAREHTCDTEKAIESNLSSTG